VRGLVGAALWQLDQDIATQSSARGGGEKDSGRRPLWGTDGKVLAFAGNKGWQGGVCFSPIKMVREVYSLAPLTGTKSSTAGDWQKR